MIFLCGSCSGLDKLQERVFIDLLVGNAGFHCEDIYFLREHALTERMKE
jgi:hypothetical protein